MAGTIQGTGNTHYDAAMERVLTTFLPGGVVPNGLSLSVLVSKMASGEITPISLRNEALGAGYIICGFSKVGGSDVCG